MCTKDYWPIIIVVLILLFVLFKTRETFVVRTLDQTAFQHPDPVLFKYTGRLRDPTGSDSYDRYYENNMLYNQHVTGEYQGAQAFANNAPNVRLRATTEEVFGIDEGTKSRSPVPSTEPFVGGMSY